MKEKKAPDLMETINDPRGFILSLVGAEALAKRGEEGPLTRPWRAMPVKPATVPVKPEKK